LLERARVPPADQTARRQTTAAAPDVDGTLIESLRQLRNARFTIDQPEQYAQLSWGQPSPLNHLKHVLEGRPRGAGGGSGPAMIVAIATQARREQAGLDIEKPHVPENVAERT
jgi:hypothetical protein